MNKAWALWLGVCFSVELSSQTRLTLDEAIQIGLENNFDIRIARVNEEIAANNNTIGNAGGLPVARTTGGLTYTSNNTRQQFFSGDVREGKSAGNTNARAGLEFTWTAFDGYRMQARKERLDQLEGRSKDLTALQMHNLVTQIQADYYDLVRQQQQIQIVKEAIMLDLALRNLAQQKLRLGVTTELEVLQTTNQLNADSSALVSREDILQRSVIAFNRLIGRGPDAVFAPDTAFVRQVLPVQSELLRRSLSTHPQIKLLQTDEKLALIQLKEAKADLFPTIGVNAGYNFNYSRAEVGFLLSNRSFGPTGGITLNYDIFPGRNLKKDFANIDLFRKTLELTRQDLELDLQAQIAQWYAQYQNLLAQSELEARFVSTAQRNTQLANQLLAQGRTTDFEVREAILRESQAKDRLSDVQYRLKLAETQLWSLSGNPLGQN